MGILVSKRVLQTLPASVQIQGFRYHHFMKGLIMYMDTIGERIIFLREEREISQKALAIEIGITATTLSRYENGIYEPKAEIIRRLAVALNTTSDWLMHGFPQARRSVSLHKSLSRRTPADQILQGIE